jgi:hypothetical protein
VRPERATQREAEGAELRRQVHAPVSLRILQKYCRLTGNAICSSGGHPALHMPLIGVR